MWFLYLLLLLFWYVIYSFQLCICWRETVEGRCGCCDFNKNGIANYEQNMFHLIHSFLVSFFSFFFVFFLLLFCWLGSGEEESEGMWISPFKSTVVFVITNFAWILFLGNWNCSSWFCHFCDLCFMSDVSCSSWLFTMSGLDVSIVVVRFWVSARLCLASVLQWWWFSVWMVEAAETIKLVVYFEFCHAFLALCYSPSCSYM